MNNIKIIRLIFSIVGIIPAALQASLDMKHAAERYPAVSVAGIHLASATAAARTQSVALATQEEEREKRLRKQYFCVQPVVGYNDGALEQVALLTHALYPETRILYALFAQAVDQKETKKVYELMHHPDIKEHLKDAKNAQELNIHALVDAQGKTVLEHAIENNDACFVGVHAKKLSDEQRQIALRYAADKERPRVLLALLPKNAGESDESALKRYFFGIQNLKMSEYKTYKEALALAGQYRKDHAKIMCSKMLHRFPAYVQTSVTKMLHPTVSIAGKNNATVCMHKQLEKAIIAGDCKKVQELGAGWHIGGQNNQGLDALALAVYKGQLEILKILVDRVPFIVEQRRNELKQLAEEQTEYYKKCLSYDPEAQKKYEDYTQIACLMNNAWSDRTQDTALMNAITENRTGDFMQALENGANPNALIHIGRPVAVETLMIDPIFLKMLLDTGKLDKNILAINDHQHYALLWLTIRLNKPDHMKLLLDAGFDPNAVVNCTRFGNFIVGMAIENKNPKFLEMLLAKGVHIDGMINTFTRQRKMSYIDFAIKYSTPEHVRLLQIAKAKQTEEEYIYSCA